MRYRKVLHANKMLIVKYMYGESQQNEDIHYCNRIHVKYFDFGEL